ncbi:sugar ABC transporter permease [Streptomyces uncialis]|uniref:sugar ABC transporter permease n=1 Tax=Streptomyces uncialis TaxID=1048205 RepID=UPI003869814C|nr:sugar ABC transporter permease [Streptomyces uncialis]
MSTDMFPETVSGTDSATGATSATDSAAATGAGWADRALADVVERVAVTRAQVGTRFPLYADPADGRWTTTGRGSWTGGFWAGLLWLRAGFTGDRADREAAAACTARLAPWTDADTATRGLILWYGTAPAGDDPAAAALRDRAARACLHSWEPELGIVPWGDAFGGPRELARVDGVPGMVPLLAGAGAGAGAGTVVGTASDAAAGLRPEAGPGPGPGPGPDGVAAAAAHLHRHLELCLGKGSFRDTPRDTPRDPVQAPFRPAWQRTATGWRPCEDPGPGWSRGPAWLLLAVADALLRPEVAARVPGDLTVAVERLLTEGGVLTGPLVPYADTDRPDGPLDTSAAAITAVALLKLARVPGPHARTYARRAGAILERLVRDHLSEPRPGRPAGMLLDGCYDAPRGLAVRHELVWGDFFLALALAALTGAADLTQV